MNILLRNIAFYLLQTLLLFSCTTKKAVQGNWKLTTYTFLDSAGRPSSTFDLNDEQSIRFFLINEMSVDPTKSEEDSIIALLKTNHLILSGDSTYDLKGLGLILPTSTPGFQFSSTVKGKWNYYSDTLSLSLDKNDVKNFKVLSYNGDRLLLETITDNKIPINKFVLSRH